jgi:hypothetical protein
VPVRPSHVSVTGQPLTFDLTVAAHRAKHALPPLQTFTIDVISPDHASLDHEDSEMLKATKMSSTFIREWIVKHQSERHMN